MRVAAVRSYDILNSSEEEIFNALVRAASRVCDAPMAVLNFVDSDRQWLKASFGADAHQGARSIQFCSHTMHEADILIVEDTLEDARFSDDAAAAAGRPIRFYAGVPIKTAEADVGALSVMDWMPRTLHVRQIEALQSLGEAATRLLELRRTKGLAVFAKAVDLSSDGVTITGGTGRSCKILYANDSFLQLTGYEFHEVVNRDCTFAFADDAEPVWLALEESCKARKMTTIDCRIHRKTGEIAWDRVSFVPYVDETDALVYTVALHRDISSYKEVEAQASKLHAMRTTMATVNHAVNNFMNAAQLYSQRIASGAEIPPNERHLFQAALRNAQHQLAAINRLGTFRDRPTPFGVSLLDLDDGF